MLGRLTLLVVAVVVAVVAVVADLAPDLAARELLGVPVGVDRAAAQSLADLGQLTGRDALVCGADHVRRVDRAFDGARTGRAHRLVTRARLRSAEERNDAAREAARAEVDVCLEHVRREPL